jgi:hypothetical protein
VASSLYWCDFFLEIKNSLFQALRPIFLKPFRRAELAIVAQRAWTHAVTEHETAHERASEKNV